MRVELVGNSGAGRPPKPGDRYPSGQLKPDNSIAPALLVRIRRAAEEGYADGRLASQIGRLYFHRQLSSAEASTAFRVGEIYSRYHANNGLRRSAKSPSYQTGFGATPAEFPDPERDERMRADEEAWLALQDELVVFPRQARAAIEQLCVDDEPISSLYLPDIKAVLHKLGAFLRKSSSRKRRRRTAAPAAVAVRPALATTPPPVLRRLDRDRQAWLAVQRKLRPDLNERQLQEAYEIFIAVKDRAAFNDSKVR